MIGWIKIKSKSSDEHEERGSADVGLNAHAKSSVLYRRSVAESFFTKFSLHDWLPTFLNCEWCLAAPFARAASSAFK